MGKYPLDIDHLVKIISNDSLFRLKDGKPIRSQMKYSTSAAWERRATLKVSRAKLEDSGMFSCQAKNTAGETETNCRLTVCQKPTIELQLDTASSANVNKVPGKPDALTGRVGGRLVLKATTEAFPKIDSAVWFIKGQRIDTELTPDVQSRVTTNEPYVAPKTSGEALNQTFYLTMTDLTLQDMGDFGLTVTNSAGPAKAAVRLTLNDRPQPPMSVQVASSRGPDWMTLAWERPASDGGSKLTGYIVERRVVAGLEGTPVRDMQWATVGRPGPYEDQLRISGCEPNTVYSFRVSAQNDIGTSDATETESPYQFRSLTGTFLITFTYRQTIIYR